MALSSAETTIFGDFLGECGEQFLPRVAKQIHTFFVPSSSKLSYRAVEELRRDRFRDAFRDYLHHVAAGDATREGIHEKVVRDLAHLLREVEPNAAMTAGYGATACWGPFLTVSGWSVRCSTFARSTNAKRSGGGRSF